MIVLVVTYLHAYTIQDYLNTWGISLRSRIKMLFYEDLFCRRSLPRGAYIFTDLERLSSLQRQRAEIVACYLAQQGLPVLNRPQAVLRRCELLTTLYKEGVNCFRAARLQDVDDSLRFPVFLRLENDHNGPVSERIPNARELQNAIGEAIYHGAPPDELLVVEFCDTADDSGTYRKYSAFLIGDRFVTRHLLFSKNWVTKFVGTIDEREAQEEREYLFEEPHPHEKQLRTIFRQAAVDYGRIDYALLNGQLLVWEINTNPTIVTPRKRLSPLRAGALREIAARLRAAFEELADAQASSPGAPLLIPPTLRGKLGASRHEIWKQPLRQGSRPFRFRLHQMKSDLCQKLGL